MITNDREYRQFEVRAEGENKVEGYAAVFDTEAVIAEIGGVAYKERLERSAFNSADMGNVVMNYNHGGKPVARTKNGTLSLSIDDAGLRVSADLSGTDEGRRLYEEIRGGYIDKMSFAFTVAEDEMDRKTHTRSIRGIKRLYDVAAVVFPAYDTTTIQARSFFEVEAEKERMEVRTALAKAKYFYNHAEKRS